MEKKFEDMFKDFAWTGLGTFVGRCVRRIDQAIEAFVDGAEG